MACLTSLKKEKKIVLRHVFKRAQQKSKELHIVLKHFIGKAMKTDSLCIHTYTHTHT